MNESKSSIPEWEIKDYAYFPFDISSSFEDIPTELPILRLLLLERRFPGIIAALTFQIEYTLKLFDKVEQDHNISEEDLLEQMIVNWRSDLGFPV